MKKLFLLAMSLCVSGVFAQSLPYVPKPAAMFISSDGTGNLGTWVPETGAGAGSIPNVPQTIFGAYCSTDGTGNVGTWAPCNQPSSSAILRTASGYCTGTATSSATLSIMNMGGNNFACTGTSGAAGMLLIGSGTLSNLSVRCNTTGVSAASGVFTLNDLRAGVGTTTPLTVTYGTTAGGTMVQDTTHTYAYLPGDMIRVNYTTQAAETLANCDVSFNY